MRKISNKRCLLSINYAEELAAWEEGTLKDKTFENYISSNFRHYCTIKMELLRCQDGLCAYTEKIFVLRNIMMRIIGKMALIMEIAKNLPQPKVN